MTGPRDPDEGERPEDIELLARLAAVLAPEPTTPIAADRIAAVRARAAQIPAVDQPSVPPSPIGRARRRSGRRELLMGSAAAGLGLVLGVGAGRATAPEGAVAAGPPTEPIAFDGVPTGVDASARLINHTWGVELLLDVANLAPGGAYDVRYTSVDGDEIAAGSFVAVPDVVMKCRFNGALLRGQTAAIEVRGRDDDVRMSARLV